MIEPCCAIAISIAIFGFVIGFFMGLVLPNIIR